MKIPASTLPSSCRATRCAFVLLCAVVTLVAAETAVISRQGDLFGTDHSGFRPPPPGTNTTEQWTRAPVANDGVVNFMSREKALFGQPLPESGPLDWHVFRSDAPGTVTVQSLKVGDCKEIAQFDTLFFEVRELTDGGAQQLFWRQDQHTPTAIEVPGMVAFHHLHAIGGGETAYLTFSASSSETGTLRIYVQPFNYDTPSGAWSASGTPVEWVEWVEWASDGSHDSPYALYGCLSADGSTIAFLRDREVYLQQGATGTPAALTALAYGYCRELVLSADGTTVFFTAEDTDTDTRTLYWHDRETGLTQTVAPVGDGAFSASPQCSDDGRFAVFRATASDLLQNRTIDSTHAQTYLWDRDVQAVTACLSLTDDGATADATCYGPAISPSGRYITFSTAAENLTGTQDVRQVLRVDRGPGWENHAPEAARTRLPCPLNAQCALPLPVRDDQGGEMTYRIAGYPNGTFQDAPAAGTWFGKDELPLLYTGTVAGDYDLKYEVRDEDGFLGYGHAVLAVADYTDSKPERLTPPPEDQDQWVWEEYWKDAPADSEDIPAASADGRWLLFTRVQPLGADPLRKRTILRDTLSDREWPVTDSGSNNRLTPMPVALSADGSAFVASDGNTLHYGRIRYGCPLLTDTVSIDAPECSQVAMSASGKTVLFERENDDAPGTYDVVLWCPETATEKTLSGQTVGMPTLSADGMAAAWLNADGDVVFATADSADRQTWTNHSVSSGSLPGTAPYDRLSLSRHGAFLAYKSGDGAHVVDLRDIPSGDVPVETATIADAALPRISPGGGTLYATKQSGDYEQAFLYDLSANPPPGDRLSEASGAPGSGNSSYGTSCSRGAAAAFVSNADFGSDQLPRSIYRGVRGLPADPHAPAIQHSPLTATEDTPLDIELTASDDDVQDADLTFGIAKQPEHGTLAVQTPLFLPTFAYTPALNYNGNDTCTVTATDASGWTTEAQLSITVTPENDPPTWGEPLEATVDEGQEVDLLALAIDPDTDDTTPDVLSFEVDGTQLASSAFTPEAGGGPYTVTVTDSAGTDATGTLKVAVFTTLELAFEPGWNTFSLPGTLDSDGLASLFSLRSDLWYWQGERYVRVSSESELQAGRAFWFFRRPLAPAHVSLSVGSDSSSGAVTLPPGWSYVGPIGALPAVVAPSATTWGWDTQRRTFTLPRNGQLRRTNTYWMNNPSDSPVTVQLKLDQAAD